MKDAQDYADAVSYLFAYKQRLLREDISPDQEFSQAFYWLYQHINDIKVGKGDALEPPRTNQQLEAFGIDAYNEAKSNKSFRNGHVWDIASYIRAQANLFTYQQVAGTANNRVNEAYSWIQAAQLIQSGTKGDDPTNFVNWKPASKKPGSSATDNQILVIDPLIITQPVEYTAPETKNWKKEYENQVRINQQLSGQNQQLSLSNRKLRHEMAALQEKITRYEIEQSKTGPGENKADSDDTYKIVLHDVGDSIIRTIKIVRAYTGKGLKESKALTEDLPKVVFESHDKETIRNMSNELIGAGALIKVETE